MAWVDIQLLKKLREATFAPLKDCREALIESQWDFDKAQQILRDKGMSKASKKADRLTNEGIVKIVKNDWRIYALKLLCETDFVAKNENFHELFDSLLNKLFAVKENVDTYSSLEKTLLDELELMVSEFIWKLWENTKIWEVIISDKNAYVYNHPWNKVASIIYYSGNEDMAKELALQVAAMNPEYISFDAVPEDYRNELLAKFKEEMKDSWKPENIVEQIIAWKLQKHLSDLVLLEQEYIRDNTKKVKEILGDDFVVEWFSRIAI